MGLPNYIGVALSRGGKGEKKINRRSVLLFVGMVPGSITMQKSKTKQRKGERGVLRCQEVLKKPEVKNQKNLLRKAE